MGPGKQVIARAGGERVQETVPEFAVPEAPETLAAPAASTGDVVLDALVRLRASSNVIDRNTAKAIDSGERLVRYKEDLAVPPNEAQLLAAQNLEEPHKYVVRICPDGEPRTFLRSSLAFAHRDGGRWWFFVSKHLPVTAMALVLVHETNHSMRLDGGSPSLADSFGRYKAEFQAYWVANFRWMKNLDAREEKVRETVLAEYPDLRKQYENDPKFRTDVLGHKRPEGNVLNSAQWQTIEKLLALPYPDEHQQAICDAISAMSPEERVTVSRDTSFVEMLRQKLSKAVFATVMEHLRPQPSPSDRDPGDFPKPAPGPVAA